MSALSSVSLFRVSAKAFFSPFFIYRPESLHPESMAPLAGIEAAAFWLTASCTSFRASKAFPAVLVLLQPAGLQPTLYGGSECLSCRDVTRTRIFQLMKLGWNLSRHSAIYLPCIFVISKVYRCFSGLSVQSGRGDSNSWPHDSRSRALPLSYIRIFFNMLLPSSGTDDAANKSDTQSAHRWIRFNYKVRCYLSDGFRPVHAQNITVVRGSSVIFGFLKATVPIMSGLLSQEDNSI